MGQVINEEALRHWRYLLDEGRETMLMTLLQESPEVEVAEFLGSLPAQTLIRYLSLFDQKKQSLIFSYLPESRWRELYHYLSKEIFAYLFSELKSDQRADFYQKLTDREQALLLPFLSKHVRSDVIMLSAYPPETAGGIMSTDFTTIRNDITAQEAIDDLRKEKHPQQTLYNLYVINSDRIMLGIVPLKDLVVSHPETPVNKLINTHFIYATVDEDQESVAQKIERYGLVAIPVLNEEKQLLGTVSYEDAIGVIREEQTEDMEKFMGIVSTEETEEYLSTSSWQHFKRRVGWIVGLFAVSFISQYVLHRYEGIIHKFTLLALYIPMITDAGGNAGSQAATVVIRALSLGEIKLSSWLKIIFKESKVAIMLAFCLFAITFLKVLLLSGSNFTNNDLSIYNFALAISLAVACQVISSTIIGASLPLIAKRFQGDPAVAASPAITTIVDITGVVIYFTIISIMLL